MNSVKRALTAASILLAVCTPAHAVEQDKLLHFTTAYGAQITCSGVLHKAAGFKKTGAQLLCGVLVFSLGFLKEAQDPLSDMSDIKANTAGIAAGALTYSFMF